MRRIYFIYGAVLLLSYPLDASAQALDNLPNAPFRITRTWLDEHLAVSGNRPKQGHGSNLARTQIWASGLGRRQSDAFNADAAARIVGAKVQPFQSLNLQIGTELSRSDADAGSLSSTASWHAFWSQGHASLDVPSLKLATSGSLANFEGDYSQTVSGTLGLPLNLALDGWSTQVMLSPNMTFDLASGSLGTGLMSEIVAQTVLSAHDDAFRSVLNVKIGYGVAADARPSAAAMLEIKVSPNL
jgi:hypothetical protein